MDCSLINIMLTVVVSLLLFYAQLHNGNVKQVLKYCDKSSTAYLEETRFVLIINYATRKSTLCYVMKPLKKCVQKSHACVTFSAATQYNIIVPTYFVQKDDSAKTQFSFHNVKIDFYLNCVVSFYRVTLSHLTRYECNEHPRRCGPLIYF